MSNFLYPAAKEKFLRGELNLITDVIKAQLVSAAYVYNASHEFRSSLAGEVGTAQTLGSKTVSLGVFASGPITFNGLTGPTVTQMIIFKDTGNPASSPLIARFDTGPTGPVAIVPNGGNVMITWDTSPPRIFAL